MKLSGLCRSKSLNSNILILKAKKLVKIFFKLLWNQWRKRSVTTDLYEAFRNICEALKNIYINEDILL